MKKSKYPSKVLTAGILAVSMLALVAWSPPANEDITITTGSPAVVLGIDNQFNSFRGFIGGNTNYVSSVSTTGYSALFGNGNTANILSTVLAGNSNTIGNGATAGVFSDSVRHSGIFGSGNVVPKGRYGLLISGGSNSINAHNSLVSGFDNMIVADAQGNPAFHSVALGESNSVSTTHGYLIGYQNSVSADRGVAIGSGALANTANGTALGKYNAEMAADDVLVIGNGTSVNARSTALRVTADGGVLLGRPQGDISMGAYQ